MNQHEDDRVDEIEDKLTPEQIESVRSFSWGPEVKQAMHDALERIQAQEEDEK